eukprot:scaffold93559_cov78-Phaeocystis_antarctica.AAC.2
MGSPSLGAAGNGGTMPVWFKATATAEVAQCRALTAERHCRMARCLASTLSGSATKACLTVRSKSCWTASRGGVLMLCSRDRSRVYGNCSTTTARFLRVAVTTYFYKHEKPG